MAKTIASAIAAFLFVAACGLFIAAAGGAEWGTFSGGGIAFLTLVFGFAAAVFVGIAVAEHQERSRNGR